MITLELEKMSWPMIGKAIEEGYKTVIIPAGAVEQHGPHLPECTDAYVAYQVCLKLAERLGKALVAPGIRPGLSAHHTMFPGSLTLRKEIFMGIVEDYIDCYVKYGFENFVLVSGHGGNYNTLDECAEIAKEKYPNIKILNCINNQDMEVFLPNIEKEEGLPEGAIGLSHSCDYETSMMLAYYPELVDMSKVEKGTIGHLTVEAVEKLHKFGMKSVTENGILGDPRFAKAERGFRNMERLVNLCEKKARAVIED